MDVEPVDGNRTQEMVPSTASPDLQHRHCSHAPEFAGLCLNPSASFCMPHSLVPATTVCDLNSCHHLLLVSPSSIPAPAQFLVHTGARENMKHWLSFFKGSRGFPWHSGATPTPATLSVGLCVSPPHPPHFRWLITQL